jgi:hypothetical protein
VLQWREGKKQNFSLLQKESPIAAVPGHVKLDLRLFGVIPFKKVTLQVVPPVKVMAGGHSIGVLLTADGVMVVGYSHITLKNGSKVCPAKEVDLLPGALILNVEGTAVHSDLHLSYLIDHLSSCLILRPVIHNNYLIYPWHMKNGIDSIKDPILLIVSRNQYRNQTKFTSLFQRGEECLRCLFNTILPWITVHSHHQGHLAINSINIIYSGKMRILVITHIRNSGITVFNPVNI